MLKTKLGKYILALALVGSIAASAAPIDEAKRLYRNGKYDQAIEKLRVILRKSPRDGTANYYLGAALYASGRADEATEPLKKAVSRGVADASRILAEASLAEYSVDEASEFMESWEEQLKKDKKDLPESYSELNNRIIALKNMLDRVEKLEILDSLSVPEADFFNAIRLSPEAGSILASEAINKLGVATKGARLSTAYLPQNRNLVVWSETDSADVFTLHSASILADGSVEQAQVLEGNLGDGGDAKYPFLMPDGVTLYFANNGKNSLGGYDIFMTRQSDDGLFYAPQNMGFPYNSPANDYLLAIDESAGLGWLVTDRNSPEGYVTIYVFEPSQMRVNVEPGDENLLSYARLDNIALTRKPDTDYAEILKRKLPAQSEEGSDTKASFAFDAGNGKVYTSLSDFRNRVARGEMIKYLAAVRELDKQLAKEQNLRLRYRNGDKSLSKKILASEATTETMRLNVAELRNKVVRLENRK